MAHVTSDEPATSRPGTFAALRNPNYRRYFIGQGISLIGTWLQAAAVKWIVFDRTHSESVLGRVDAASLLPGLFVGLVAGALADRVSSRKMVIAMNAAMMVLAFGLAALVGFGVAEIWQMALILALTRVCVTFEMPSRQVFLYSVVGRADLSNAVALNSGLFNASRVIGPALAGICLAWLGGPACFALNGLSYLAAIAAVGSIRGVKSGRGKARHDEPAKLLGGLFHLRSDSRLATLFTLMAFFGVVAMGYDAMIPAYARKVLSTGVAGYSVLLSSSGVGATLGALTVATLAFRIRKEHLVQAGLALFALGLAAAATIPARVESVLPAWVAFAVASGALLIAGFGAVMFYSATQALIQTTVPDGLRGRIMGIWMIIYSASVPLGSLWTGLAAQRWGITPVLTLSSGLCAAVAIVVLVSGVLRRPTENLSGVHESPRSTHGLEPAGDALDNPILDSFGPDGRLTVINH